MSSKRLQIVPLSALAVVAITGIVHVAVSLDTADSTDAASRAMSAIPEYDGLAIDDCSEAAFCCHGKPIGDVGMTNDRHHHAVRFSESNDVPSNEVLFRIGSSADDDAVVEVIISSEADGADEESLRELADFLFDSGQRGTCRMALNEVLATMSANVCSVFVAECGTSMLSDSRHTASAAILTVDEESAEDMTVGALSDDTSDVPDGILNRQAADAVAALPVPVAAAPAVPVQPVSLICPGAFSSWP